MMPDLKQRAMLAAMDPEGLNEDNGNRPDPDEAKLRCPQCGYEAPEEAFQPVEG